MDSRHAIRSALKFCRSIGFGTRFFHTGGVVHCFHESHPKGGYQKKDDTPFKDRVRHGFTQLKDEIKIWKQEVKEKFEMDVPFIRPGVPDRLWTFDNVEAVNQFTVTADSDHGEGFSSAQFHLGPNRTGLFEGYLSTKVPKEGRVKRAGYCGIRSYRAKKSFQRDSYWDWTGYTHIVLKVRGDGRSYVLNLGSAGLFDILWNDVYQFVLYTRGGPHWQYSKVPISKFFAASKGRIQDKQFPLHLSFVSHFGITLGDKNDGPFRLEIDWIGLEHDPVHVEDFAYEQYKVDKYVANH